MSAITFGFTTQQIVDEGRIKWEDINLLKKWLKTENLPKITDEQIVCFLLSCFNEQESTRKTIKAHYTIKKRGAEIFDNRNLQREDLQKQLNTLPGVRKINTFLNRDKDLSIGIGLFKFCVCPQRTDDGCIVAIIRFHDLYYGNFEIGPTMKLLYMTLDAAIHEHPPNGLIIIIDLKGFGIMHLTRFRIGLLKTFFEYLQEGLQMRLKKIHVLNTVWFIEKVMYIVKPFLKSHVLEMISFHQADLDMNLFFEEWLPKKCLPEDYDGDLAPLPTLHERNIQKMTNFQSYYEQEELQRRSVD